MKKLSTYRQKRKFKETPEPAGKSNKNKPEDSFVIQRHAARRLHFDFRIQSEGVLKSWAVPNGVPLTSNDKRLAVQTEDHPLEYGKFAGTIPEGNYGAGKVAIWDKGRFENKTTKYKSLEEGIKKGHFVILLKGKHIRGTYGLTRTKEKNWILVKKKEFEAKKYPDNAEVIIDKRKINLTNLNKVIFQDLRKGDLVEYYGKVSKLMLKHIADRPISMYRFPNGVGKEAFFQKNIPDYFPKWIKRKAIKHKSGTTNYVLCNDKATLLYLANQVTVPHIWGSRVTKFGYPDIMIFDLDPSNEKMVYLHRVVLNLKKFLEDISFTPYIMTTGGKGFHIHVPIKEDSTPEEVRQFAGKIAEVFASHYPETTTEIMKARRGDKIFIDVNRNSPQQTAVAPYAVRANEKATIAMPIFWEELETVVPQTFTIDTARERFELDPWHDFSKHKVSIKKVQRELKKK